MITQERIAKKFNIKTIFAVIKTHDNLAKGWINEVVIAFDREKDADDYIQAYKWKKKMNLHKRAVSLEIYSHLGDESYDFVEMVALHKSVMRHIENEKHLRKKIAKEQERLDNLPEEDEEEPIMLQRKRKSKDKENNE